MNCREFSEILMEEVRHQCGYSIEVTHRTLLKNNGIQKEALELYVSEDFLAPSIYVDSYYENFQKGVSVKQLAAMLLRNYYALEERPKPPEGFFKDFSSISGRIYCRLINYEKNRELLQEIPHEKWLDLAIVYYYLLEDELLQDATILIHNAHLLFWGVDEKKLRDAAWYNTIHGMKPVFQTLGSALKEVELEMMGEVFSETEEMMRQNNLYIVTNRKKSFGAIGICHPGQLQKIAQVLDSDFYLLPSSVHECLILAGDEEYCLEDLSEMVREINESQVEAQEVLADHAYFYDRRTGKFTF